MLLALAGPAVPAQAAQTAQTAEASEITDGLALWYKLDAGSGATVPDASGHGRDGTVNGTADWSASGQGLAFNGSDTYIKVPDNVMKDMNSITVSMDVLIDSAQSTPYFIYGFGNSSGSNGNGYLFTTGNSFRTSLATGNWSTEQTTKPADSHNLTRSVWTHLAYAQTGRSDRVEHRTVQARPGIPRREETRPRIPGPRTRSVGAGRGAKAGDQWAHNRSGHTAEHQSWQQDALPLSL